MLLKSESDMSCQWDREKLELSFRVQYNGGKIALKPSAPIRTD